MKIKKITVEKSKVVRDVKNFNPNEETQIRVMDADTSENIGVGVIVALTDGVNLLITKEFIDHFSQRLKSGD